MTEPHKITTEVPFTRFVLDPRIQQGLAEMGLTHCTPIQALTLPLTLDGRDVAGQAQTGTGKTAAFAIATLQRLLQHGARHGRQPNQPRALVLAPTRELAVQIARDFDTIGIHSGVRCVAVIGGTGYDTQRRALEQGVDILIGTPGRIIDYFRQGVFDLKMLEVLILDEADRMFDLGFIKDIRFLIRRAPRPDQRMSMLFSATLSMRVQELAYEHMNNPESVDVTLDRITADQVRQCYYMVANDEKIPLMIGLMRHLNPARSIVFVNTKHECNRVWGYLEGNGFHSAILSGDVPQKKRLSLLKHFQEGGIRVLVATDVAARGLHIPDVTHIFNYDLPNDPEDYVHRIGRTARAGASGDAISFACETFAMNLVGIEDYLGHKLSSEHPTDDLLPVIEYSSRVRPKKSEEDHLPRHSGDRRRERHDGPPRSHRSSRPAAVETATASVPAASPQEAPAASAGAEATAGVPQRRRRTRNRHSAVREAVVPVAADQAVAQVPASGAESARGELRPKRRRRRGTRGGRTAGEAAGGSETGAVTADAVESNGGGSTPPLSS